MELESQKLEFHVDATWRPLRVKLESLRLGLLKVKPGLRDSSFKALFLLLPGVMSGWSCVGVVMSIAVCFETYSENILDLVLATKTCLSL